MEQLIVFVHCPFVEYSVKWRLDLVFECKAVPTELAMLKVQNTCVEPTQDIGRVVLRIRAPDGGLEVRREVVAIQAIGGFGQSRPGWSVACKRCSKTADIEHIRYRLHQQFGKVACPEQEIRLERLQVVHELELVVERL